MKCLVEVHNENELEAVLSSGAKIIGINNRDLRDFSVDLQRTLEIRKLIPLDVTVVSESGIHSRKDIEALEVAGVDAVLVGEALVLSPDPIAKIRALLEHR